MISMHVQTNAYRSVHSSICLATQSGQLLIIVFVTFHWNHWFKSHIEQNISVWSNKTNWKWSRDLLMYACYETKCANEFIACVWSYVICSLIFKLNHVTYAHLFSFHCIKRSYILISFFICSLLLFPYKDMY